MDVVVVVVVIVVVVANGESAQIQCRWGRQEGNWKADAMSRYEMDAKTPTVKSTVPKGSNELHPWLEVK